MEDRTDNVVPVLKYLLDRGSDPLVPDDKGYSPLHNAAEHGAFLTLCPRNFFEMIYRGH
jgi:ankyrin repeat protein